MSYTADLTPGMTGYTTVAGTASASSEYNTTYRAWKAFDHANGVNDSWVAATGTTGWLQYQFPMARAVTEYAVTSRNEGANSRVPKSWTFQGSNNGTSWDTLDTQTNVTDWAYFASTRKVFTVASPSSYTYYRLNISATNFSSADYVSVGELELIVTSGAVTYPPRSIGAGIGVGIASGIG